MCRLDHRRKRRTQTPQPPPRAPQPQPYRLRMGIGGSGPAQLALAILAEHLGDDHTALNLYQRFKWACIAPIRSASWSLSSEEIDDCLAQLSEQQEDAELSTDSLSQ
jgi:hypothetical protein